MDPRNYHRRRELEALRRAHNDVLTTQLEGLHRVRSESAHKTSTAANKKKKKIRRSDLLLSMADSQQYHKRVVGKAELAARLAQRRLAQRALRSAAGGGDDDNGEVDYGVDDEEEYAALLAEGVNEELLLDDGVVANIKRRQQNGLGLESDDDGSDDEDSEFGGGGGAGAAASGNDGDKLLDDEYYYKRSLNLGSISTGREVWGGGGGGGGKREPNGTAEQRLKRRQAPVLATHLVDVHTHVRQFYEVLSAWLAPTTTTTSSPQSTSDPAFLTQDVGDEAGGTTTTTASTDQQSSSNPRRNSPNHNSTDSGAHHHPPFPFALTWLRTVLPPDADETAEGHTHPSALGRLSEAEAVKVLKKQVARSQKCNESSMYDPSDYGPLQESILSYLSLTYFAVAKAVSNNNNGSGGNGTPNRAQSPLHPPTTSKTHNNGGGGGGWENGGTAGGHHRDSVTGSSGSGGRSSPHFPTCNNNNTTTTASSARAKISPPREKRPSSSGTFSDRQSRTAAAAPAAPPPPKLISMNIARALCRPGSASVAVHTQAPGTRVGSASTTHRHHQPSLLPPTSPRNGGDGTTTTTTSRPATAGMPVTYASPRDRSFGKASSGANRDKHHLGDSVVSVQEQAIKTGARLGVDSVHSHGDNEDADCGVVEWNPQHPSSNTTTMNASSSSTGRPGTAPAPPTGARRAMTSTVQSMDLPHGSSSSSTRPTTAANNPPLSYRPRPPTGTVEFAKPVTASITSSSSSAMVVVADPPDACREGTSGGGGGGGALVSRDHFGVSTELAQRPSTTAVRPDGLMQSSGPGSEAAMPPQPTSPATVKPVSTTATVGPMMGSPGSYKATWGPHSDAKWVGRRK